MQKLFFSPSAEAPDKFRKFHVKNIHFILKFPA